MKKFIVTARIQFPTKAGAAPIETGLIRMEIPAEDEPGARSKARAFITSKLTVGIDSCVSQDDKEFQATMKQFGDIFKGGIFGT